MDSEHRASGQHSLPLWSESPGTGSGSRAVLNGLSRFLHRNTSAASLDSIATRLPRYSVLGSQQSILGQDTDSSLTLRHDELYTNGETTNPQSTADDDDTRTLSEDASLPDNSNTRASVASVSPPRYSLIPPRYYGVFGTTAQQVTAEGVSRTEHTYSIGSGLKNKPWATFRVFSKPPRGSLSRHQKFPRFSSGDVIAGLIELTLDNPQTVNSITVSLRGRIIRGHLAGESDTFLDHQVSIWTRTVGDPRSPDPGSTKRFDGKLKGLYHFPFAFPFPTHVDISTSTAFSPPLKTPSDPAGSSSSSPPSASVSLSRSSSDFPPATNASFFSDSKNAASVHMSSNHHFTGAGHTSEIPMTNISSSRRHEKPLSQERHQNDVDTSPVPKAPEESEKARLTRTAAEQDRTRAQLEINRLANSLSVHIHPTPQTFLERGIHANVQYELGLHIAHGMLRPASKLKTAVIYTPSITPPPASVARQLAYAEGAPLPGPTADPDGWQTLPKVTVYGELLDHGQVEVGCTLSLAKPLCYTRGAVIPCYLTLESSNSHALGLLSTPESPFVRLTRRVRYSQLASSTVDNISNESSPAFGMLTGDSVAPTAEFSGSSWAGGKNINLVSGGKCGNMIQEIDEAELAVWWLQKDTPQEMHLKRLEGEIHLAKDLQPTCNFLPFRVEYAIEMLPMVSHLFEPVPSQREKCLLVQPVEIATCYSEGPTPTAFTEPISDREREKRKREKEKEKAQVEIVYTIIAGSS